MFLHRIFGFTNKQTVTTSEFFVTDTQNRLHIQKIKTNENK